MAARRASLVIRAKLCESSNLYEDMVNVIREIVTILPKTKHLTPEERELLAVAYKFEVGARRRSLRALQKLQGNRGLNATKTKMLKEYETIVTRELTDLCSELLSMLDKKLIPTVKDKESDIFYHKLKGDYCRYLAEVEHNPDKVTQLIQTAKENYDGATKYAEKGLAATHPLRIGLAMNYSVFICEMLDDISRAQVHAKRFYDEALDELEAVREVDEIKYNECARLLALMHENIKIWTAPANNTLTSSNFPETRAKHF